MKTYENIHDAYVNTLADVYDNPDYVAEPRGQRTREKLNYQFCVTDPTVEPIRTFDLKRNEVIKDYTAKEMALYDSCTDDVEDFAEASKFWLRLQNPDGTVNSAYGALIWEKKSYGNPNFELDKEIREAAGQYPVEVWHAKRTPWQWCKESLLKDKDTRQAVLHFNLPEHAWVGVKDFTCTMYGIFLIRDNKINLTISMRSNDLTLGLVYDLSWFVSLMYKMRDELKEMYPDLGIGTYTHFVNSLHIYDRDQEKILKMLGRV
jgi:thymidylate synthase